MERPDIAECDDWTMCEDVSLALVWDICGYVEDLEQCIRLMVAEMGDEREPGWTVADELAAMYRHVAHRWQDK